jgi:hypothetical protein
MTRSDMTRSDMTRSDMTRSDMTRSDMTHSDITRSTYGCSIISTRYPSGSLTKHSREPPSRTE